MFSIVIDLPEEEDVSRLRVARSPQYEHRFQPHHGHHGGFGGGGYPGGGGRGGGGYYPQPQVAQSQATAQAQSFNLQGNFVCFR